MIKLGDRSAIESTVGEELADSPMLVEVDPVTPPAFGDIVQTGEERSQEMELDMTGRVLPGWDVIATYAYIDAEISRGDAVAREGNALPNAPLHSGSLWSVYRTHL